MFLSTFSCSIAALQFVCFIFFIYFWDFLINLFSRKQGVQPCAFYLQNGHCKFGSTCKFDHPLGSLSYSPSVSSFIDVPVTPYPVGSLLSQLAPSTSSELRPELMSGSKKESLSARIPSSGTSVGLIFSQGGSISLSDVQLSSQSSAPLGSSRSTRQSGEIR